MACHNRPSDIDQRKTGRCHVCEKEESVGFCPICCHWFCRPCSFNIFKRGIAFVREVLGGPKDGCCGPVETAHTFEASELNQ